MPTLDVFNNNAFSLIELTSATNLIPSVPGFISRKNLFKKKGVRSRVVWMEFMNSKLTILPTKPTGWTPYGTTSSRGPRKGRYVEIPHIPIYDSILAEDVQGIRAFGSETELESVSQVVNDLIAQYKQNYELTWEFHRIGALTGLVVDADGSTLLDLFDVFEVDQKTVDIQFGISDTAPGDNLKAKALEIQRHMAQSLGGTPFNGITAFCSNGYFDMLTADPEIYLAYERWNDGQFFREQQGGDPQTGAGTGFVFAGIEWLNYAPTVGDRSPIAANTAVFVPSAAIFDEFYASADMMDTVNTVGVPLYTMQEEMDYRKGITLHMQSNPLMICNRPNALVKSTGSQDS